MIQRWSSACFLLLMPLAIRSMPGGGDPGGLRPPAKAAQHATSAGAAAPGTAGARTAEPLPPLGVSVETTSLQKNPRGGVASLLLKVNASVAIEDAVLTARAPGRVVFADGSAARTWNVDLATGGSATVPVEVIVPEDGKYSIAVEVSGLAQGKSIHRATSHKLLVGVKERKGKTKDGAIEFKAIEAKQPADQQEGA
jgi:hypothetical protein